MSIMSGLTVPDSSTPTARFYCDVFGAHELYRLGPFDAAELPRMEDGRDWTEAHINVGGARLTIAMLSIGPNLMLELFQYDRPAGPARAAAAQLRFRWTPHRVQGRRTSKPPKAYLANHGCKVIGRPHRARPGAMRHDPRQLRSRSIRQSARTRRVRGAGF